MGGNYEEMMKQLSSAEILKLLCHAFLVQCLIALVDSKDEFKYVTCGSVVKLYNQRQGIRLHSHDVKYGSGSGQQSVTGSPSADDNNSYWVVKGEHKGHCTRGTKVKCGDKLRLQHLSTKRNLHSHLFQSPISHNQEVSAFGEEGDGDTGDNWIVKCSGKFWNRKDKIRFKHDDTERYLHASSDQYGRPIAGQHEICAYHNEDSANLWVAQAGVYVKETK